MYCIAKTYQFRVKQRSCADVNSLSKRKRWTSQGVLYLIHYSELLIRMWGFMEDPELSSHGCLYLLAFGKNHKIAQKWSIFTWKQCGWCCTCTIHIWCIWVICAVPFLHTPPTPPSPHPKLSMGKKWLKITFTSPFIVNLLHKLTKAFARFFMLGFYRILLHASAITSCWYW